MDLITRFVLLSLFKIVSPATLKIISPEITSTSVIPNISSTTVIPLKEDVMTSSSYQVTENIKDIPDNRTLAPIVPNFGFLTPLNFGNNTIAFYNNNKQPNIESSEENTVDFKNNTEGNLKKNSFSILHIKAEYDDKPVTEHHNVFSKVFGGIKAYVFHLKRGVVDGLHSFFHHNDKPDKEIEFQNHGTHRHFDGVEDLGDEHDYYDDESGEHFDHY